MCGCELFVLTHYKIQLTTAVPRPVYFNCQLSHIELNVCCPLPYKNQSYFFPTYITHVLQ